MSIQRLPDWHQIEQPVVISLKTARHHLWGNVPVYLGLFIIELLGARWGHSQALRADAFNNLSGTFFDRATHDWSIHRQSHAR